MAGLRLPDCNLPFHPTETLALCVWVGDKKAPGFQQLSHISRTRIGFAAQKITQIISRKKAHKTFELEFVLWFRDRDEAETGETDSRQLAQLET